MQFKSWETRKEWCIRQSQDRQLTNVNNLSVNKFYTLYIQNAEGQIPTADTETAAALGYTELAWYLQQRPYYNLWPALVPIVSRSSLALPLSYVVQRLKEIPPVINIRLAEALIVGEKQYTGSLIAIDPQGRAFSCFCREDKTQELVAVSGEWGRLETLQSVSDTVESDIAAWFLRLLGFLVLAQDSPELFTPVDFIDSVSPKSPEPRGDRGWDVGKHFEISPHYRRAHFGIRWTEKGRSVPKLVLIKGAVVKRKKLTDIPTGYLDKEPAE